MPDVRGPPQVDTPWVQPIKEHPWTPVSTPSTSIPFSTGPDSSRAGWQDSLSMAIRMTSAHFVGRAAELAELQAALRDAAESQASIALAGGESGVRKPRLAEELSRHARESAARVLSGDCVELGEDELPYAPLLT